MIIYRDFFYFFRIYFNLGIDYKTRHSYNYLATIKLVINKKGGIFMDREKLLENSRKEMYKEVDEQVRVLATRLGSVIVVSLAGVIILLDFEWGKHFSFDIFSLGLAYGASMDFAEYYYYRKTRKLVTCITAVVGAVICLVIHFGIIKIW